LNDVNRRDREAFEQSVELDRFREFDAKSKLETLKDKAKI